MENMRFNWVGSFFTMFTGLAMCYSGVAEPSNLKVNLFSGLTITNPVGTVCKIEYSTDLAQAKWSTLTNVVLTSSPCLFVDTTAPATCGNRFYRLSMPTLPNPDPAKLVLIQPGVFMMGQGPSAVQKTIANAFFIGKNVVSQGEYVEVMGLNPAENAVGANYPVESVSWASAVSYCNALTQRESSAGRLPQGWAYRLPTEAEWEYACRAGTTTRFCFGEDPDYTLLHSYAWYASNSQMMTHPVQTRLANPWGLYDMYGNVRQWCQDVSAENTMARIWRGSGFDSNGSVCTSAARGQDMVTSSQNSLGFRVVAAPIQP